jgi:hypothetical protein
LQAFGAVGANWMLDPPSSQRDHFAQYGRAPIDRRTQQQSNGAWRRAPGIPEEESMTDKTAETRRIAAELGLTGLNDKQLAQFAKGLTATRDLLAHLPKDLHWSEEPANTLSVRPSQRRAS